MADDTKILNDREKHEMNKEDEENRLARSEPSSSMRERIAQVPANIIADSDDVQIKSAVYNITSLTISRAVGENETLEVARLETREKSQTAAPDTTDADDHESLSAMNARLVMENETLRARLITVESDKQKTLSEMAEKLKSTESELKEACLMRNRLEKMTKRLKLSAFNDSLKRENNDALCQQQQQRLTADLADAQSKSTEQLEKITKLNTTNSKLNERLTEAKSTITQLRKDKERLLRNPDRKRQFETDSELRVSKQTITRLSEEIKELKALRPFQDPEQTQKLKLVNEEIESLKGDIRILNIMLKRERRPNNPSNPAAET